MWLPDYVLLLNKFGGRLISTEKVTLLSIPPITWEHFLLISTTHLRSRTRVTTCFLNLFLARLDCFSPKKISELIQKKSISTDSAVLAALAFKAVTHLKNQPGDISSEILEWEKVIFGLNIKPVAAEDLKPLFKQLPFPRKMDPDFKVAGLAYTGFEYSPKKYTIF